MRKKDKILGIDVGSISVSIAELTREKEIARMSEKAKILVLGIGNLLMGDEGVGIQAVRRLELEKWPGKVDFLDGGTGGFHLLSYLEEYPHIVIIDASLDNFPEGHVRYIRPRFAKDFPPTLSAE